ncbi:hypothetical protein [Listeria rustica]|uniref:Uncharacterized protein n=1 Tax=Listeria rustica TaxID=2713503 RepID=A0A7W1YFZ2_9LIST|nr:hypothetical protein [Listeria rustica]MBA3926220.1 hypothetical protein [Listeria rustica]
MKSSKIDTKSIKVQNQEQAANELAKFIVGLGAGTLGVVGKTVGAVLTIMGGSAIVKQLFTGKVGAQYPIKVITYVYFANKPTGTYAGYTIIVVRNATTGKVIQSKRNTIARTGA